MRTTAQSLYRVALLAESDRAGIATASSPVWDCGAYDTLDQLNELLSQRISRDTPGRAELLNQLRNSFRARARAIGFGTATHPLWDTTRGEYGPLGFRLAFSVLNKHAARVGLNKYSDGYAEPIAGE